MFSVGGGCVVTPVWHAVFMVGEGPKKHVQIRDFFGFVYKRVVRRELAAFPSMRRRSPVLLPWGWGLANGIGWVRRWW